MITENLKAINDFQSGVIKAALNFIWLVDTLCGGCCSSRFPMQLAHDSRALIPTSLLVTPIERGLVGGFWDQLLLSCQALGWDWGRRRSRRGPAGASSSNDTSTNSWWHPGHFSEWEWEREQLVMMPLSNLTIQPQLTPYYYPTALIALSALRQHKVHLEIHWHFSLRGNHPSADHQALSHWQPNENHSHSHWRPQESDGTSITILLQLVLSSQFNFNWHRLNIFSNSIIIRASVAEVLVWLQYYALQVDGAQLKITHTQWWES